MKEGETLRNAALAETLAWVAEDGARLFIDGPIDQEIVRQNKDSGGHLTFDDLAKYEVVRRRPLHQHFLDADIALNPAPAASGPLLAFALNLLKSLTPDARHAPEVLADVMRRSNDARRDFDGDIKDISDQTVHHHLAEMQGHVLAPRGTTHISVIDREGNAAAATVSNGEGNSVMVGDHGFMLNNMLGEEDLNPNGFDRWKPGQRMSTMMAPTLIATKDGGMVALGSGGSNRIRSAVLQVLLGILDRGLSAEDAVAAPRLHVEKCGNLSFEGGFSEADHRALLSFYPDARIWPEPNMFFGGVHIAQRLADGSFEGVGDARRFGYAIVV